VGSGHNPLLRGRVGCRAYNCPDCADDAFDLTRGEFADRELLKQFREVEQLPEADKQVVKILFDAFLTKRQIQALVR